MTVTTKHYAGELVGKTVRGVRELSKAEMENMMWYTSMYSCPTCVIEFTDGTFALVACDPELNGTGFLDIGKY